jgi:hypothetical protein
LRWVCPRWFRATPGKQRESGVGDFLNAIQILRGGDNRPAGVGNRQVNSQRAGALSPAPSIGANREALREV